jgi:transposase-like protein
VEKSFLEDCLARSMSLEAIGELVGKHPSTVSYWLKKHGLEASHAERHAPKGSVDAERICRMAGEGSSIREIAKALDLGYSTVRYWLKRLEVETERSVRQKISDAAREAGLRKAYLYCPRHGHTAFFQRSDGGFRCLKCNIAAVSERRRRVKRQLVQEAGGCCRICGFKEHQAALQFHHRDPSQKLFHLSHKGMTRGINRMRVEAKKCVLLCANCHALVEAGVKEVPAEDR